MIHPGGRALAATLLVAPPLAVLLWLSGALAPASAAAAMLLFVFVVMLAGLLLLRAAGAADMPAPAAWALGSFATALAVYALCLLLACTAAAAFALWAIAVAGLALWQRRAPSVARRLDAAEVAGLLLCAALTVMWCRDIAGAPLRLARGEPLLAFVDFLIHGGVISQLGDPLAAGRGSIDLVDFPAPAYHYASYALAAVFAAPLELPGLALATSVWLPLGFFTMCAGAYALGAALAGPAGGVAALGALALVPDPASYGLHNGMLGYHWGVIAAPGATYAVGFCLLAVAFLKRWMASGDRRALLAAAALAAGTALVRVHVFALAFPALLASAAMATRAVRRRKLVFLALALAALAAFTIGFYETLPYAVPALERALDNMHNDMEPTAYAGWYRELFFTHGVGIALLAGVLLLLVGTLGALVLLYPLSAWLVYRSRGLGAIDLVPAAFLVCYLLLLGLAPVSQHGDPTEFTQRPFVILYAVLVIWTALGFLQRLCPPGAPAERRAWQGLLLAAAAALVLVWPHAAALGSQPRYKWGTAYYAMQVVPGLSRAADFLRANARPGDVFAAPDVRFSWVATDTATELIALSGMPAYLGRPFIHLSRGGRREAVVRERYAALAGVAAEQDVAGALARLRALGIQWYVVPGVAGPRWDPQRARAAFVAGRVAVYSSR
jgi:hypothetical protein